MLVNFHVSNFRSFRQPQTLTMVAAARDKQHPDNLIDTDSYKAKLAKTAAIYGHNASGKSNLLAAMKTMAWFVSRSATHLNQGDVVPGISPFRLDSESPELPTTFEISYIIDGRICEYGFSTTADRVHDEWLRLRTPGSRKVTWFERSFDRCTNETTWKFNGPLKEYGNILQRTTRPNGLLLSRAAEQNVEEVVPLYLWFKNRAWHFDLSQPTSLLAAETAKLASRNELFFSRVRDLIRDADVGIRDLRITEEDVTVPETVRKLLSEEMIDNLEGIGSTQHKVRALHVRSDSDELTSFDMDDESNGTQRLFALAGPILTALENGSLMIVDELDCSMHPLLTRKIVELFNSETANSRGAQLVFTTHDTSLLDQRLLRRDQLWLTEKDDRGETSLFSLQDFGPNDKPRSTESFQRRYLAGRYGGVPILGPVYEDLLIPDSPTTR